MANCSTGDINPSTLGFTLLSIRNWIEVVLFPFSLCLFLSYVIRYLLKACPFSSASISSTRHCGISLNLSAPSSCACGKSLL